MLFGQVLVVFLVEAPEHAAIKLLFKEEVSDPARNLVGGQELSHF